jgi:hypothetical protein
MSQEILTEILNILEIALTIVVLRELNKMFEGGKKELPPYK